MFSIILILKDPQGMFDSDTSFFFTMTIKKFYYKF